MILYSFDNRFPVLQTPRVVGKPRVISVGRVINSFPKAFPDAVVSEAQRYRPVCRVERLVYGNCARRAARPARWNSRPEIADDDWGEISGHALGESDFDQVPSTAFFSVEKRCK